MDQVLDQLAQESPAGYRHAVHLLTPDVLETSSEQSKHKLKTTISAMLKSSGPRRAYGAVLARLAFSDWSIVKSHGSSWAVVMLHVLDLPDRVGWKPIMKTLTLLFLKVRGKPELSREIAGSKVGDFVKRLVNTVPHTKSFEVVVAMLQAYPTQSRPYINKLAAVIDDSNVKASFAFSEKNGTTFWQEKVSELLTQLAEPTSEFDTVTGFTQLRAYLETAPTLRVKVPAQKILNLLLSTMGKLKPVVALTAIQFMLDTFQIMATAYMQHFEDLTYKLAECTHLGMKQHVRAIKVMTLLITELGGISEKYSHVVIRLVKGVLALLTEVKPPLGANGLADYAQSPASFASSNVSNADAKVLSAFLATVSKNVSGIPQSLRVRSDRAVLEHGTTQDIVTATLYPAKYSILPLSINALPELNGMEALVHPRFPPLNISKHDAENLETFNDGEPEDVEEVRSEAVSEPVSTKAEEDHVNSAGIEEPEKPKSIGDLPHIPEAIAPKRKNEVLSPPEKRKRTDMLSGENIASVETAAVEREAPEAELKDINEKVEEEQDDDDDGDELVIPTLTMDSD